jgi:mycobactin peptide synthetase MbtE
MIFQHELLKSLRSNSKKNAIESAGKALSYAELLNAADKVTVRLLNEGVRPQTMVGIQVIDRIDLICSIIGVLNAGCIFVPIDGTLPEKRLAAITQDLDLNYMISAASYSTNFTRENGSPVNIIFIEDCLQPANNKPDEPVKYPGYTTRDSIYVYFTSGSTGRPKGIIGKNSSLLHFLRWEIETFGINATTRVSQLISPYFDAFLRDIFVPLLAGGTICIPPGDAGFLAPDSIISWIDEAGINIIHCVPSVFRVINNNSLTSRHFKSLKYILLSGEKIIPTELESWYRLFGARIQIVNLYGATESTMIKTYYLIQPEDAKAGRISIGTPIHNSRMAILNKDLLPCKPLVPGDLYIVSDYMTKGYLNNPELTHEKFVQLNATSGNMAYKTGDKARILADGKIDLMGREDRQVKLRGIRIELDEIETALMSLDTVKNAVVIKRTEENGDEFLVAFLIRKERAEGIQQWIREVEKYLENTLPEYMVPANIMEVDVYPLLSNGKIDYTALSNQLITRKIIAPENAIEAKILSIWKEILGEKAISTDDSFHKIGGNSLSIMKLIGRIYKEYNVRISLSELFNNLTIKKQAEFVKRSNKDVLYVIPKAISKPAYHVSSAQERMFYSQQLNKESISYNLPMAWEIKGAYDKEKIERIFLALIGRHEVLRTEFKIEADELFQFVKDRVDFQISEITHEGPDLKQAIPALIRPFDLGKAPLLRCSIITGSGGKSILLVDAHHIICDGISQVNLLTEFSRLYNGEQLPPVDLQYKDYAEWEYAFKSTEEYLAHREFWLRSFEGTIPTIEIPTAHAGASHSGDGGGCTSFSIPKELLQAMVDYQHREDMTTFPGLFALYYLFLSQLTGQEE